MIIIKKDDVVIFRIKGPSTPSGNEGKPRDIEYDIGDIDRWEDDGGRNPGTRSGRFRWYVDIWYYFL